MIAWILFGIPALVGAETFYAEVSVGYSSVQALRVHQQVSSEGRLNHLVRRYRQGKGWEYLLLSGEFDSVGAALARGSAWARVLGRGVTIYRDGAPHSEVPVKEPRQSPPGADILIARLSRTLGGEDGGLQQLSGAANVRFVYEREVEEDGVYYAMKHVFTRREAGVDMTIEPIRGAGVGSRLSFDGESAWVRTEGAAMEAMDSTGVSELLSRMGPSGVFTYVLELPTLLQSAPLYQNLELSESLQRGGRSCGVLASSDSNGGVQLVVDPMDWWLLEASILGDMGLVTYRFGDWREVDTNLVLPFQYELVRDGHVLEKIRVLELSLENADSPPEGHMTSSLDPLP